MADPWQVRRTAPTRWVVEATADTRELSIVEQQYDTKLGRAVMWCWNCWKIDCADVEKVKAFLAEAHITDCD